MGKRPLVLGVALLASLLPFRTAPQSIQISQAENFQMRLEGFSDCKLNQLTPQERQAVKQSAEDRNFEDCLTGSPECDANRLSSQQKLEVTLPVRHADRADKRVCFSLASDMASAFRTKRAIAGQDGPSGL